MANKCNQCNFYDDKTCRGVIPRITADGPIWLAIEPSQLACPIFKFKQEVSDAPDAEVLYNYIKMGKKRTMRQIETYLLDWNIHRVAQAIDELTKSKHIEGKQQGVAYYIVCMDTKKAYKTTQFDTKQWLLDTLVYTTYTPIRELTEKYAISTGKQFDLQLSQTITQALHDGLIESTVGNGKTGMMYRRVKI